MVFTVSVLHQHSSANRADVDLWPGLTGGREQADEPQIFFLLQKGTRFRFEIGCDDDLTKNFADRFGQRFIDRPVADDDSTKRRTFVGGECFLPRRTQIDIGTHPAGIGVFQNRDRRFLKLGDQISRRADVENVVKRKFLAVEFFEMSIEVAVKRRGLMRVFPVAQTHGKRQRKRE